MRSSISHGNKRTAICNYLAERLEKWWAKYVLGPFVITLVPSLIFVFFRFPSIHQKLPNSLVNFLNNNQVLVLVLTVSCIYFLTVMYGFIQGCAKNSEEIDTAGLLSLFTTLERVVGAKADRFDSAVKKFEDDKYSADPKVIFLEITQPSQQIALLAEGLHGFFDAIDKTDVSFKVTIASISNGVPIEWFYYTPQSEPPRTPMDVLQNPNSSICRAISTRRMVIIEDFKAEAEKGKDGYYAVESDAEIDNGSLICYPIFDPRRGTVPYVLTVVADKKKHFLKQKKPIYQWVVERFVVRIKLEHHLEELKQKAAEYIENEG